MKYPLLDVIIKDINKNEICTMRNVELELMSGLNQQQLPYELKYLHEKGYIQVFADDIGTRVITFRQYPNDYDGTRIQKRLF